MEETKENNKNNKPKVKSIGGFIASSLDLEDRMLSEVYYEYLDFKKWPKNLEEDIFQMIKTLLTILINDTKEHRKIFLDLQEEIGDNNEK